MKKSKGFTLIELLIVITIIGILAVALVPKISQGPARARDVQRKADMHNIASALELHYADHGTYPAEDDTECLVNYPYDYLEDYLGGTTPTPPPGADATIECGGTSYIYATTDGAGYTLAAGMETQSDSYYCDTPSKWYEDFTGELCTTSYTGDLYYYVIER